MAYSKAAVAARKCKGTTKAGKPCRAWAVWDDPRQLCVNHAGRHHRGKMDGVWKANPRARYPLCSCEAYSFPHRPGGGLCRYPDEPLYKLTTPPSTHTGESWWGCSGEVVLLRVEEPRRVEAPPEPSLSEQLARYGPILAPLLQKVEDSRR